MGKIIELLNDLNEDSTPYHIIEAAQNHAAIIKEMQGLFERGLFDEGCAEHYAKCAGAFVRLMELCDLDLPVECFAESEGLRLILQTGQGYVPESQIFIPAPPEPTLSQMLDTKYGPPADYAWCRHGFVHGIDCPDGCTSQQCSKEPWPRTECEGCRFPPMDCEGPETCKLLNPTPKEIASDIAEDEL